MTYQIGPNTPLRLAKAAALGFPDGGMTEKGLRREHARGNLTIERIANKDYTTLASIEEMRRLCRLAPGVQRARAEPRGAELETFLAGLKARKERVVARRREQKKP